MAGDTQINHWKAVDGGFRGSVLLAAGALASASGSLVNLAAELLAGQDAPSQQLTIAAWLLYILGLWLLGAGFCWLGAQPFMSRFGFVPGALHLVHGAYLLVVLFTTSGAAIPPVSLTVGRLVATIMFAVVERDRLAARTWQGLAWAAALILAKAGARTLGWLPRLGAPLDPLLDAVFLLGLAAALLQLAATARDQENAWAQRVYESSHADFADFNNPEHVWNKKPAGD